MPCDCKSLSRAGLFYAVQAILQTLGVVVVDYPSTHVRMCKLLQICKQVVTRLLSSRYQDVFALLVPSCCDKSGKSWYHFVTRLMTKNRLATSCSNKTMQYKLFVTSRDSNIIPGGKLYKYFVDENIHNLYRNHQP